MSEIYIIAGPPRSRTSVTTGIVHHLGIPAGLGGFVNDNEPDEWNSRGQFADREFRDFVVSRLPLLTRPSPDYVPDDETLAEIRRMIDARSGKFALKGNNSYVGAKVLRAMGYDVRLIVCDRELSQSQASFVERVDVSLKDEAAQYVADAKADIDALYEAWDADKRLRIDTDRIYDDTKAVVAEIAAFCGVSLTPEAIAIVDHNARRFV